MDFYSAAQVFARISAPGNFLIFMLLIGFALSATRYRRTGRRIVFVIAATLAILLVFPVGYWTMSPLEDRFPRPRLPDRVDGILVLGGGENPDLFARRGTEAVIASEGRLVEAVELSRRFPQARIVFTGFEAKVARAAFLQMGVEINRFTFEDRARNTWENLSFSKNLIGPRTGETWLLVTHAASMPRAIGVARKVGWDVIAWPVDYQTGVPGHLLGLRFPGNITGLETAMHEWIGLFVYRLTGRSAAWFPSP